MVIATKGQADDTRGLSWPDPPLALGNCGALGNSIDRGIRGIDPGIDIGCHDELGADGIDPGMDIGCHDELEADAKWVPRSSVLGPPTVSIRKVDDGALGNLGPMVGIVDEVVIDTAEGALSHLSSWYMLSGGCFRPLWHTDPRLVQCLHLRQR